MQKRRDIENMFYMQQNTFALARVLQKLLLFATRARYRPSQLHIREYLWFNGDPRSQNAKS